jgi:hypothetical protein
MSMRWWRRNWWGLLALAPVLVAIVLLSPDEPYQTWWKAEPREPVHTRADGWVSYAGARLRLAQLAPAQLLDAAGEPFPVPEGLRAWQATVTIEPGADPEALAGCELRLEDGDGRLFGSGPSELDEAELADGDLFFADSCYPPEDDEAGGGGFETVAVFLLPAAADPAALRVSVLAQLPVYARLEVG